MDVHHLAYKYIMHISMLKVINYVYRAKKSTVYFVKNNSYNLLFCTLIILKSLLWGQTIFFIVPQAFTSKFFCFRFTINI